MANRTNGNRVQLSFIGVGAAKSGTSWLEACLAEHPQICMSDPKELNYFCDRAIWPEFRVNKDLGQEWLATRFDHSQPEQLLGEYSPNYLCDVRSPMLIKKHNPKCRLLFLFRHPVEALHSYYQQLRRDSPIPDVFEEFLEEFSEIRQMGMYHFHAQRFLEVFEREQCWFRLFEDVHADPIKTLQECQAFLGVDPDFTADSANRRINDRMVPRSTLMVKVINQSRHLLTNWASEPRFRQLMWSLKLPQLGEWAVGRNLKQGSLVPIAESTRKQLLKFYREDTRALAIMLNKDLSHWER